MWYEKYKPFGQRVIIKRDEVKAGGGLFLPTEARDGTCRIDEGTVVEKGDDCIWVEPGMKVMWGAYAGKDYKVFGSDEKIFICNEEDLIAKIQEQPA